MKKVKSLTALLVALTFTIFLSGALKADAFIGQGNTGQNHLNLNFSVLKALFQLNLTTEQKQDIAAILKGYQDEVKNAVDDVAAARKNLFETIHGDTYNETAVRDASKGVAIAEEELAVLRAKIASDIKTVLTAEQLSTLETMKADIYTAIQDKIDTVKTLVDQWIQNHS